MQEKDKLFGSWALYLSFEIYYEVNIMQLCSFSIYYSCIFAKHKYRVLIRVCVCVCASVYVLHDNSKNNQSRNMKVEYIVVYENISDKLDNGHCRIKVKVKVGL